MNNWQKTWQNDIHNYHILDDKCLSPKKLIKRMRQEFVLPRYDFLGLANNLVTISQPVLLYSNEYEFPKTIGYFFNIIRNIITKRVNMKPSEIPVMFSWELPELHQLMVLFCANDILSSRMLFNEKSIIPELLQLEMVYNIKVRSMKDIFMVPKTNLNSD